MHVTEGGVELEVPGESTEGIDAAVFYNPDQELNRDLTVAVLRAFRDRWPDAATYLDGMTASGVRGIRAAADGWRVSCCDADPTATDLARENLDRNGLTASVHTRDVNALCHEESFDVVDLDPFGTPMPFADAAFASARRLVCVTATDTAPLCGAHFASGVRHYDAVPRNTDYHREMGLRILLGALTRVAARRDVGVTPLFAHATRHYVRTYLAVRETATAANVALESLGFLAHCEDCLFRTHAHGRFPELPRTCPNCESDRVLRAGPLWLDRTVDPEFVASARTRVDDAWGSAEQARSLLETVADELDRPTHYDQHVLCKRWGVPANAMEAFLGDLVDAGHAVSRTHHGGTTFKTDATVEEIRAAAAPDPVDGAD